jgi:hypothetical protein
VQTNLIGSFMSPPRPPDSRLVPVYRVGETEPFFWFCPAPRIFGRIVPLTWAEKAGIIADHFHCHVEHVGSIELSDGTECITLDGAIVASFDHPVELKQLLAESANYHG